MTGPLKVPYACAQMTAAGAAADIGAHTHHRGT